MYAQTTTTTPTSINAGNWLQRAMHAVRQMTRPREVAPAAPLTRRQMLLMAQDRKRAEERARRQASLTRQHNA
ncbi:hypothetical protein [Dyella sp.]|uniref:hypothetical protein n=1 Tax=Dyella sp. TaxID=1869338 RepID=UPI002ED5B784